MSITSGLRSGLISGMRSGLNPSYAAAAWTVDSTSGKALPATGTEWDALLASAGVSGSATSVWPFSAVASGNVSDTAGSKTLTAAGTMTYQQTVTGWAAKAIKMSRAVAGTLTNNTFGDVASTAATLYLTVGLDAVNTADSTLTLMRYGTLFDDDACLELKVSSLTLLKASVGEGDATRTNGTADVGGTVRMFALSCGASIAGYHDQENIGGGTRACNGTEICFGGDNFNTNFPGDWRLINAAYVNATHSAANVKAVMQAAGWTVGW